jgi:predicted nucleic acid-binding protein
MSDVVYVLDTNVVSSLRSVKHPTLIHRFQEHKDYVFCLCEPVIFEVERGYAHRQAYQQLTVFRVQFIPLFVVVPVQMADWRLAAVLWGDARRRGCQLSDVDVLLAAMTLRVDGILITDDRDFACLPSVKTENWLKNAE